MRKIALIMPPIWTPDMPPLGITAIKSYMQTFGHQVDCFDLNVDDGLFTAWAHLRNRDDREIVGQLVLETTSVFSASRPIEEMWGTTVKTIADLLEFERDSEVEHQAFLAALAIRDVLSTVAQKVCSACYDIVGISAFTSTLDAGCWLLREVKRLKPETTTVVGGPSASNESEVLEGLDYVDFVITGHGEVPFRTLVDAGCKASSKILRATKMDVRSEGLASYPLMDYSDYPLASYGLLQRNIVPGTSEHWPGTPKLMMGVTFANGCRYACRFCDWQQHFRFADVNSGDRVYKEMQHLSSEYGVTHFHVCSAEMNQLALDVAERVAADNAPFSWFGPASVNPDLFSPANVPLLQKGGLRSPRFGVESGSPKVLKLMRKHHKPEDTLPTVSNLAAEDITSHLMVIVNFPGEGADEFEETLTMLREIKNATPKTTISCNTWKLLPFANGGLTWYNKNFGPIRKRAKTTEPIFATHYDYDLPSHVLPKVGQERRRILGELFAAVLRGWPERDPPYR